MNRLITLAAVVAALVATAMAGASAERWLLPDDSVKSRHIQPETIRAGDIADEAVSWRTLGWRVQAHLDPERLVFRMNDGRRYLCTTLPIRRDFVFDCEEIEPWLGDDGGDER